jgi:hypothetical protein
MAPSTTEETVTVWYRNTEHDTVHEVVKGSDLEKRLRREQRQVGDEEDDLVPAYERISEQAARKNPEKQPGYVKPKARKSAEGSVAQPGLSEDEVQARVEAAVKTAVAELVDALQAEKAAAEQPPEPDAGTPEKPKA